ncbi:hypothetical protein HD554DRAFT_1784158 [Boletus coccyginus]|nr:hypothetical protein HD554DRAFT_1784158 [Boletus coccyginus]
MDLSWSPLLARDDDTSSDNFTELESDERVVPTTMEPDCAAKTSEEGAQAPLQRGRSARIKEITLKSRDRPTSDTERDSSSGTPREFTLRLPFTSTPPHQKPDSFARSPRRILRSHSQRLLNSGQPTKTNASLGRSQSERYPRASDLAFVTINRPRYHFMQHKSKGTKVVKGDEAFYPPMSPSSPAHGACQPQQGIQIGTEYSDGKHESEKENGDPKVGELLREHVLVKKKWRRRRL